MGTLDGEENGGCYCSPVSGARYADYVYLRLRAEMNMFRYVLYGRISFVERYRLDTKLLRHEVSPQKNNLFLSA